MKASTARNGIAAAILIGTVAAVATLRPERASSPRPLATAVAATVKGAPPALAERTRAGRSLRFEANVGQAAEDVRFVAHTPGFRAEVLDDGLRVSKPVAAGDQSGARSSARLRFVGAMPARVIDAQERAEGTTSYLRGSDPSRWLQNIASWKQLRQQAVYPGIDLVYYGRDDALEYDLVVRPGADPAAIRIAVEAGAKPAIAADGDLLLDGAEGSLRMHRPVLYQTSASGARHAVEGRYVMRSAREVGFRLGAYDRSRPLVIDPTFKLLYATYLGGVHDDQVGGIVLDAQNNAYVVGNSGSEDFPVSGNAYQNTRKAIGRYVRNVVVTKFDASGTLVYSTFIGGTTNDYGTAIAVDATGRASITGSTNSPDFPVTANAYQSAFRGSQSAYLATLSSDGSTLAYSTFYGGTGGASGSGVFVEAAGSLLIGGTAGPGLSTTAGSYKPTLATGNAAFLARFDTGAASAAQLLAATYYGTDAPQTNFLATGNAAYTVAVDAAGSPWLTGQAYTTNLPVSTAPPIASPAAMTAGCSPGQVPLNSFAYVAHLSADLKSLLFASYLTGNNGGQATCAEYGHGLAFDAAGNVYVGGSTSSLLYPTTAGVPQPTSPANASFDGYAGFITKIKADGSAILWSTYLGGNAGRTYLTGLLTDAAGALWMLASSAGGSNFPITSDALQATHGGGAFDVSLTRLDPATAAIQYSTFLGGAGDDFIAGVALDSSGNAYLAGATSSVNFPTTADALQPAITPNAYDGADWFFSVLGSGAISSIVPTEGGNGGSATLHATTTGLDPATLADLVGGGRTFAATSIALDAGKTVADIVFVLDGVPPGTYDLRLTQPDGTVLTKAAAFTVTAGGSPALSAQIIGRPKIRTGTPAAFEVTVINSGSVDALLVPIWISLPSGVAVSIQGLDVPAAATGSPVVSEDGRNYFFQLLDKVGAHQSVSIPFTVTAPTDLASIPMRAVLQAPWARTPADATRLADAAPTSSPACVPDAVNPAFVDCSSVVLAYLAVGERPLADVEAPPPTTGIGVSALALDRKVALDLCDDSKAAYDKGFEAGKNDAKNKTTTKNPYGWGVEGASWDIGHQTGVYSVNPNGTSAGRTSTQAPGNGRKQAQGDASCPVNKPLPPPPEPVPPGGGGGSGSGGSIDPNDKFGPTGDGSAAHFFRPAAMRYEIAFENQPTASLPAADVVVTDQLDPARVDLSTLTLGDIRFGTHTIAVPPGLKSFSTIYAISASLAVRVQGSLDTATGKLKWTFTTLDPVTHLPPSDPTLGFLPPDTDGVSGQGYVGFTVSPRAGLADGTTISNQASIVFDANAPIPTPTWVNTIDTTPSTSRVQSLTGRVGTMDFDVAWSGSDTGSGVGAYTVYVSDTGGPFVAWQTAVKATSGVFTGISGHSYAFYVRSNDGAGNAEPGKSAAEATIAVEGNFAEPTSGSDGGGGGCTIGSDGVRDPTLPLLVILAAALLAIGRRRPATTRRRGEG